MQNSYNPADYRYPWQSCKKSHAWVSTTYIHDRLTPYWNRHPCSGNSEILPSSLTAFVPLLLVFATSEVKEPWVCLFSGSGLALEQETTDIRITTKKNFTIWFTED